MAADAVAHYFERIGQSWDRFWFRSVDTRLVSLLRILVGLATLWYLLTYVGHIGAWFGSAGLLPVEPVRILTGASGGDTAVYRWSYWYYIDAPAMLTAVLVGEIVVALAFTVGLFTRVTTVLSLIVILAHVHRAPMITGLWEPILSMLLLYLCLAPCGAHWSVDRWRQRHDSAREPVRESWLANLALRLMQVHLAGFYLMMGLTKLAGETWWTGDAVWWLIARPDSGLLDLTSLHRAMLFVNAWTHAIVLFELAFGALIWVRDARPVLMALSVVMWSLLAVLTGLVGFCSMMLIANCCFLRPDLRWAALDSQSAGKSVC